MPTDDLPSLCGSPRPLLVGCRTFDLWPLRLRDLARFCSWMARQYPDPRLATEIATCGLGRGARAFVLRKVEARLDDLRPTFGNPLADQLAASVEGQVELLWLSLRRGLPRMGRRGASRVYWTIGGELARAACGWAIWGDLPGARERTGGEDDDEPGGGSLDWRAIFRRFCGLPPEGSMTSQPGWNPAWFAGLTIPQLRALASDDESDGRPMSMADAVAEVRERQRKELEEWSLP